MKIDLREIPVVYINLDSATKNAEVMESSLKAAGFKHVFRKSACILPCPPGTIASNAHYVGCGQSHYEVLTDKSHSTPMLILEDDAAFTPDFNPILTLPDCTDGVYLGISHGNRFYHTKKVNDEYLRIGHVLATHAILYVSENYRTNMAHICSHMINEIHQPWDMGAANLQMSYQVYTPKMPMFYQSNDRESANQWEHYTLGGLQDRNSPSL